MFESRVPLKLQPQDKMSVFEDQTIIAILKATLESKEQKKFVADWDKAVSTNQTHSITPLTIGVSGKGLSPNLA